MSKRKRKPEQPLTDKQKKAVAMLYNGWKVKDAAAELGVHRSTIWRWECKRGFSREWSRIDRNLRRKYLRREARERAKKEEYWGEKAREAEEKLNKITQNMHGKPTKEFNQAWNEYTTALLKGRSWSEVLRDLERLKRRQCKR